MLLVLGDDVEGGVERGEDGVQQALVGGQQSRERRRELVRGVQSRRDVVAALLDEVKLKLPVLDSTLGGLDTAAKTLFNSSRYGEWLNQTIPCGALLNANGPVVPSNDPCITGAGSLQNGGPAAPSGQAQGTSQTHGAQSVTQILQKGLAP